MPDDQDNQADGVELSAVLIVGEKRQRAQRVLDRLCSQTAIDSMEIVVVDTTSGRRPRLEWPEEVRVVPVELAGTESWGRVQAEAVRRARSPVVAYIEDHCLPTPEWAERLIEAHRGPWASVAYAFTNGSPDTHLYRSVWIAEYGFWANPLKPSW